MISEHTKRVPFYKVLEENGWHKEDNQMYSPYGSFVVSGNEHLPINVIEQQNINSKKVLHRLTKIADKEKFQRSIDDLKNYIEVMEKIIIENQVKAK